MSYGGFRGLDLVLLEEGVDVIPNFARHIIKKSNQPACFVDRDLKLPHIT
jgi:hypothetical protein